MPHIIVIDDDQMARDRVIATLGVKEYTATGAPDGLSGVGLVFEHNPDLVLCDVNMPSMDGYAVLDRLRHDARTADIPFVFMTARDERDDLRRGMELGADDYLTKPFSAGELLAAVQTQLDKRRTITRKYEQALSQLRKNIVYALPHELRTPLTGSLGDAEVLRMDADTLTSGEVREMAESIIRHNKRLHHVLENFLVYAQIEVMAADEEKQAMLRNHITQNTGVVITDRAVNCAVAHGRRGDLVLDVRDAVLRIAEADLSKIVDELVDNAFKFSDAGWPVTVSAACDGDRYVLTVRDQGRGMTADQIAAIGAYMQFDRMLYEQQGLGLGLAIAQRLVDLHQGKLAIESRPAQGTVVTIHFR